MIGLFDSGLGGLTVLSALAQRFPHQRFAYLGDHAHAPYGNRPSEEVVELTKAGVQRLFGLGCRLVMLACNTATAVAARKLQREWLPASGWAQHNVIGIIAPTVEAATQTPWAVTTPQYPQKYNTDVVAVFATQRTVSSGVYPEEIRKRCPKVTVIEQACPALAGALEAGAPEAELTRMVEAYVSELMAKTGGAPPHRAILGCGGCIRASPCCPAFWPTICDGLRGRLRQLVAVEGQANRLDKLVIAEGVQAPQNGRRCLGAVLDR